MGVIAKQGAKNTIILYIGVAIGALNTIILYPHLLPVEEYGLITTLTSLSILLANIGSFGSTVSIIKFLPHFRNSASGDDKGLLRFILSSSLVISGILVSILVFTKGWIIQPYKKSAELLVDFYYYIIPLFIANLILEILSSYASGLYRTSFQLFVREVLLRLGQTILIGLYFYSIVDISSFLVGYLILFIFSFSILFYNLHKKENVSISTKIKLPKKSQKEIIKFGYYSFLSSFSRSASFRIDTIMLSILVVSDITINQGLKATAIYAVALNMASVIEMPFRAINQIISPTIAKSWKENNLSEILSVYKKSTDTMLIISGFVFITIWASIDEILTILPEKYSAVKYAFLWLGLGKLINSACGSNENILINSPKYKIFTTISALGLLFTFFTNLVFIPMLETQGAALSTFITYTLINITIWFVLYIHYKLQPFNKKNLFLIAFFLILYSLSQLIQLENFILGILIKTFFLGICFWPIIIISKISPDINSLFKNTVSKFFQK